MVVGLTGGIGSGKTTVAKMFKALGVPVYNSDKEAKRLMKRSKKVKKKIIELLGEEAYVDKKINRSYISQKIFTNEGLLKKMNSIVHPAVRKHFLTWVKKQDAPYVIQEAAIIFENSSESNYDKIILVTAPKKVRIERVVTRDDISIQKVMERMGNQWDDDIKIEKADYVIDNLNLDETENEVLRIHNQLLYT
ncbi:dephospho-CoA kinase [Saonia flava]|uniref:Dephospho-CoA kinase n=1 Tax=Saonia flava TaxID=523696 RepID=A0A846QSQ6_9FLAO|nr:dephospho-CoA kinase [Saonia flava]NJB69562.1 dephospho-CoA kinase [Saonia flava]